jgi:hypothetical protein
MSLTTTTVSDFYLVPALFALISFGLAVLAGGLNMPFACAASMFPAGFFTAASLAMWSENRRKGQTRP